MTTKYSSTYLGTVPANDEHVRFIIRSALKGTGFCLRQCGRNPNRKQFYDRYPNRVRSRIDPKTHLFVSTQRGGLQQDLPLEHATSVALYRKEKHVDFNDNTFTKRVNRARRKVADALAGQPVSVTMDTVAYLNEVKNLDKLHEVVTAIGKACKVLASA